MGDPERAESWGERRRAAVIAVAVVALFAAEEAAHVASLSLLVRSAVLGLIVGLGFAAQRRSQSRGKE
jgi:hypothetical protein